MPSVLDRQRPYRALDLALRVSCALLIVATYLGSAAATRAAAYKVPTPPFTRCFLTKLSEEATLEATMSPSDGASVQVGQSVEFSGSVNAPLSFAIASSAAQLASPDIAS